MILKYNSGGKVKTKLFYSWKNIQAVLMSIKIEEAYSIHWRVHSIWRKGKLKSTSFINSYFTQCKHIEWTFLYISKTATKSWLPLISHVGKFLSFWKYVKGKGISRKHLITVTCIKPYSWNKFRNVLQITWALLHATLIYVDWIREIECTARIW